MSSYLTAVRRIEEKIDVKMKLMTRQFGELEFDESIVYHFPYGLFGFEELHDYIIIDDKDTEPLRWLLSIEDPDVGFAILNVSFIAPELLDEVSPEELALSTLFVVVTLHRDPDPITVNLKAPVVINNATKTGKQVVLNSDKYSTEYKVN